MKKILVIAILALSTSLMAASYDEYKNYPVGGDDVRQDTSKLVAEMKSIQDVSDSVTALYSQDNTVSSTAVSSTDSDIYDLSNTRTYFPGK